jgi:hypothetical protein
METAQLVRPIRGNLARYERIFILALVAILTLGLASPAQAGLGDLGDGLLDPVEELPLIGGIVEPVVEVVEPVEEVVEPVLAPVVDPVVEVLDPVVEEVVDPVVEVVDPVVEVVDPVVEVVDPVVEVVDPVVEVVDPVVEVVDPPGSIVDHVADEPSVIEEGVSSIESVAASGPSLAGHVDQILSDVDDHGSLGLAQTLQAALASTRGTLPTVAGRLVDSSGAAWLMGLTDWLHRTANYLMDVLSIPLRLLEILVRALLTAGSGLVAPASLALAFTIYAVRDRHWVGLRKTALK